MSSKIFNKTLTLSNGHAIPRIGLGTFGLFKEIECLDAVKNALRIGYRLIDTGSLYKNEKYIGKAIKESKIPRKEITICTKIAPFDQGYMKAMICMKKSLENLDVDQLDLCLINWPGFSSLAPEDIMNREIRLETWKAMSEMQKEGKVKSIGVSNFSTEHLDHFLKNCGEITPVINQIEAHPLYFENEILDKCSKQNIAIMAYSPLAQCNKDLLEDPKILAIAKLYNQTPRKIILRWGVQRGFIVIPKSSIEEHMRENIEIGSFELKENEMKDIDSLNKGKKLFWDAKNIK